MNTRSTPSTPKPPLGKKLPNTDSQFDPISHSFDVTCVIGTVELNRDSNLTAHEAAFLLIARHDARGEFQFPMYDGRIMSVTVDYPDNETR